MIKHWKENTTVLLRMLIKRIGEGINFQSHDLDSCIKSFAEERQVGIGHVMTPLRLALVGSAIGPGVTIIMELLGRDEVLSRVNKALDSIKI